MRPATGFRQVRLDERGGLQPSTVVILVGTIGSMDELIEPTEFALEDASGNLVALDMGREIRLPSVSNYNDLPDLTGSELVEAAAGRPIRIKTAAEPYMYQWNGAGWTSTRPKSEAEKKAIAWARSRTDRQH